MRKQKIFGVHGKNIYVLILSLDGNIFMRWLTLAITIWKFIFQFNTFEDQAEINFYSFLFMYPFNINAPTKLNVLMDSEILMCLIGSEEMCEAAALKMLPRYFSIVSRLLHDIIGLVVKTKSGS